MTYFPSKWNEQRPSIQPGRVMSQGEKSIFRLYEQHLKFFI